MSTTRADSAMPCMFFYMCLGMSAHPRLCSGNRALNAPAIRVPCRFKVSLIFQLQIDGPRVCVCVQAFLGRLRVALLLCNHTTPFSYYLSPTHHQNRTNAALYWPLETGHTVHFVQFIRFFPSSHRCLGSRQQKHFSVIYCQSFLILHL